MAPPSPTALPGPKQLQLLPVNRVLHNPDQPRRTFSERGLTELAASIREVGLLQPILVRPLGHGGSGPSQGSGYYQIVAGERRFRAWTRLAAAHPDGTYAAVPCVVRELDDTAAHIAALVENVSREDLNPLERARALASLKQTLGGGWGAVADRVGLSKRAVLYLAGHLKLRPEFQRAMAAGVLSDKHGRALGRLRRWPDAAFDLFEHLLAHPGVSGDDAMALSRVMAKHPGLPAEETERLRRDPQAPKSVTRAAAEPKPRAPDRPSRAVARSLKHLARAVDVLAPPVPGRDGEPGEAPTLEMTERERMALRFLASRVRESLDALDGALARYPSRGALEGGATALASSERQAG